MSHNYCDENQKSLIDIENAKNRCNDTGSFLHRSAQAATLTAVTNTQSSFREVKRNAEEKAVAVKAKTLEAAARSYETGKRIAVETATYAVSGLDRLNSEIANHYLDDLKYGMAGSNGSCLSNYVRYYKNHHEILGMCFADRSNVTRTTGQWQYGVKPVYHFLSLLSLLVSIVCTIYFRFY